MFSLSNGYTDKKLESIRQNGATVAKPREASLDELAKKGGIVGTKALSSQAESRLIKMPEAFLFEVTRFFNPSDLACTMVVCRTLKVRLSKDVFWKAFAQKILWPVIESPFQSKVCKYYADQTKTLIRISNSLITKSNFDSYRQRIAYLPLNSSYLKAVGNLSILKYKGPSLNDLFKCMLPDIPSSATVARRMFIEADLVEYVEMIHDSWYPDTWNSAFIEAARYSAMKVLKWFPHQKLPHDVKFQALCEAVNLKVAVKYRHFSLFKNASEAAKFILSIEPFSTDEKRKAIKGSWIFKIDSVLWNHCEKAIDHDKVFEIIELFKDQVLIPSEFRLLLLNEAVTRNLLKFVEWQLPFINEEEIVEICDFAEGKNTPALDLILTKISSLPEVLRVKLVGIALKRFKFEVAKRINLLAPISKEGFLKLKEVIDSEISVGQRLSAHEVLVECAKKHMKNQDSCVIQ